MSDPIRPPPPFHRWLPTADGSYTLFNERFQDPCHSPSGARAETRCHYVEGCGLSALFTGRARVHVLEVGFGAGIGWEETRAALPGGASLDFLSLEIDEELVRWYRPQLSRHESGDAVWYEHDGPGARLRILIGDARATLPRWSYEAPFDAIYQDAFAPRKNPVLWTTEWFALLKTLAAPHAVLSTYSSSIAIRKALHAAGWAVHPGAGFADKLRSTRAFARGETDPVLLAELQRSPLPAFKDPP